MENITLFLQRHQFNNINAAQYLPQAGCMSVGGLGEAMPVYNGTCLGCRRIKGVIGLSYPSAQAKMLSVIRLIV